MYKLVITLTDVAEILRTMETDGEEMTTDNIITALTHGDMWSVDLKEEDRVNTKSCIRRIEIQMTEGGI